MVTRLSGRSIGRTFTTMTNRMVVALGVMLVAGATRSHSQGRPPRADSARSADTSQKLPTVTVRDAAENLPEVFLRRSRMHGGGKFLTAKDIEKLNPSHTPQLLARVSGGDIRDIGGGTSVIVGNRGTRMSMAASVPNELCIIRLAVNDTRVPAGFDMKAIKPEDISAIEFYGGPSSVPLELAAQMQSDADCGLFVIWLKDRRRPPR